MDPTDSDGQRRFRDSARRWLEDAVRDGPASPPVDAESMDEHRQWEARVHAAGFAGLGWPEAYGGRGRGPLIEAIFKDEYARARAPERITTIGQEIVGPALARMAEPAQCRQWLPPILDARELWALGFSEPEAGSDLAALTTVASREGEHYLVRGEKVWTSMAHWASWLLCLVRTDRDATGSRGLTLLAIEVPDPSIETVPLRQVHGRSEFCLVRLDGVRVPVSHRIGAEGEGWRGARLVFEQERGAISSPGQLEVDLEDVARVARARGSDADPAVRAELAELAALVRGYRHHVNRRLTRAAQGEPSGARASVTKLLWSQIQARIFELGRTVAGEWSQAAGGVARLVGQEDLAEWSYRYWQSRAGLIYGGATEVQRDIIARRLLRLPTGI